MTLPLESYLAQNAHVFYEQDAPAYDAVYRELARAAGIKKICDPHSRLVLVSEHRIDESSYYVFAINYHNRPATATLSLPEGSRVECVFGTPPQNGVLHLRENDGTLLRVTLVQ
jgi:hypothetical protein